MRGARGQWIERTGRFAAAKQRSVTEQIRKREHAETASRFPEKVATV